jgi:DNA processing protein
LDVVYPPENEQLYQRIAASGAVISEFPLGTAPEPGNFPVRNRLISGLALGVVVVEATEKSGSLITARMALDQNRLVFAVPGPIHQKGAVGPHRLIKEGAKLAERAQDIIEELVPMVERDLWVPPIEKDEPPVVEMPELSERERKLWDILDLEPLHIDVIARHLGVSVSQTAEVLLRLEIKGLVRQLPGTFFVRDADFNL